MKRSIIVAADFGGAALAALRHWLGMTSPAEDELLRRLLAAAADRCEAVTGVMPLVQRCEETWPARAAWQALAAGPVAAITAIEGLAPDGQRQPLPVAGYAIDLGADGTGRFRIDDPGAPARVAVRFDAGLAATWEALPDPLAHGIVRLAAALYRERDGAAAAPLPAAVGALWQPWRRVRLA